MSTTMEIKERPMLFNDEMVRAILEGRKTMTRRVAKRTESGLVVLKRPYAANVRDGVGLVWTPHAGSFEQPMPKHKISELCPFGEVGDKIWVREAWQAWQQTSHEYDEWEPITREWLDDHSLKDINEAKDHGYVHSIQHRATSNSCGPWRPSIHMPRWACRIVLEITDVRIERLNEISEEDAKAEGVKAFPSGYVFEGTGYDKAGLRHNSPSIAFACLWDEIYGADSWNANNWVWVVSFRRVGS